MPPQDHGPDLDNRFAHHPPSTDAIASHHHLMREAARWLAGQVIEYVPEGCEQALALTKIEEAMMWANAGIARHQ